MKKKLCYLLTIILIFAINVECYALQPSNNVNPVDGGAAQFPFSFWTIEMLKGVGLLGRQDTLPTLQEYANKINQVDPNANVAADETSISNWCQNNSTVNNDNSVTLNQNYINVLKGWGSIVEENGGFHYISDISLYVNANQSQSGDIYNAYRAFCSQYENNYQIFQLGYTDRVILVPRSSDLTYLYNGALTSYNQANATIYSKGSWSPINTSTYDGCRFFTFDNSTNEFSEVNTPFSLSAYYSYNGYSIDAKEQTGTFWLTSSMGSADNYWSIVGVSPHTYIAYNSDTALRGGTIGQQSYYSNSNWQDFSNSNNSTYTVDSSNSNNISYGDVNNWITNYYDDNGNYPTPTEIQIYIDNNVVNPDPTPTPTPNPDDPGGGGSDDDPTFDLGFLGTIGRLIGSLITGIGNLITGILEGIVNALTGILSFLTTLITDIADVMPQGIMDLFGAILGWLPQEWINVMSLGILSMVLIGVFKIFK